METKRNHRKKIAILMVTVCFVLLNVIAIFHVYHLTHFNIQQSEKAIPMNEMNVMDKIRVILTGYRHQRPSTSYIPTKPFIADTLTEGGIKTCVWKFTSEVGKGTVILFHGFSGEKSGMMDKALFFDSMGFHTMVVDFMGSGGSEGRVTTLGYRESIQVKQCFNYIQQQEQTPIFLMGTSMGAVAIMKALSESDIQPKGIILESPFGSMRQTIKNRFVAMGIPHFPMADAMVFWGGILHGFNAFKHRPTAYAPHIHCPTLIIHGKQDPKVQMSEIMEIHDHILGSTQLLILEHVGHDNFINRSPSKWKSNVGKFILNN
jgi:alpha-beta hydrolase superfamily lysophospholipase